MSELISVEEAERLIGVSMPIFASERVPLEQAAGRVLRQAVHAERDQPPFDRVMMDGIALAAGARSRRRFRVAGTQLAGMTQQSLEDRDACLEVTTGAILPGGCNTVIPVEQLHREGDEVVIADNYPLATGQFIHPRGSDCRQGASLLEPGVRLNAPAMAVLAANGIAEVDVAASPKVAIVATGDELADVDAPLREGQIRRSNDRALQAALHQRGIHDVSLTRIADDLDATTDRLRELLAEREVLVLSGGVSVGQRDYVPEALRMLGVRQVFHRIAQRPGKPMWFGIGPQGQVVFALPGNPVSVLVCAVRYVLPALGHAMGQTAAPPIRVRLDDDVAANPGLTCFVPVHVHHDTMGQAIARPAPVRTSGDFSALPGTHGFVQLPAGEAIVAAGTVADFHEW